MVADTAKMYKRKELEELFSLMMCVMASTVDDQQIVRLVEFAYQDQNRLTELQLRFCDVVEVNNFIKISEIL